MQRWWKGIEVQCVVILWKNIYPALKIIDVGIFLFFYFIKISFHVHFLFKWRQNLSARPRIALIVTERGNIFVRNVTSGTRIR